MNDIGISVLKLKNRKSNHHKCFSTLIDDNCDFHIVSKYEDNLVRSRREALDDLVTMGYRYIGFVDDDDELIPDIYTELLHIFQDYPDTSIAFAEQIIVGSDYRIHNILSENRNAVEICRSIAAMHQPVLIPSDIYKKYSYVFDSERHTERSLYGEIQKHETSKYIRVLTKAGYIYNKR